MSEIRHNALFAVVYAIVVAWSTTGATAPAAPGHLTQNPSSYQVTTDRPLTLPPWKCGDSTAHFEFTVDVIRQTPENIKRAGVPARRAHTRIQSAFVAELNGRSTVIRFDADFIGGACATGLGNRPLIVLQSFCAGSASFCSDYDGWTLIDAHDLSLEMFDASRESAKKVLGTEPPTIKPLFSTVDLTGKGIVSVVNPG